MDEFGLHNGYLIGNIGNYGTDYTLRALTDKIGVGALKPKIAIYAFTQTAHDLSPLVGGSRYVLHIPADQLPIPAKQFWSVTMYDAEIFLVPNPIDRYLINDRSDLHLNPDGSLDIYVQPDAPSDPQQAQNWLPSPADGGGFRLIWRFYEPGDARAGNPRRQRLAAARDPALRAQAPRPTAPPAHPDRDRSSGPLGRGGQTRLRRPAVVRRRPYSEDPDDLGGVDVAVVGAPDRRARHRPSRDAVGPRAIRAASGDGSAGAHLDAGSIRSRRCA